MENVSTPRQFVLGSNLVPGDTINVWWQDSPDTIRGFSEKTGKTKFNTQRFIFFDNMYEVVLEETKSYWVHSLDDNDTSRGLSPGDKITSAIFQELEGVELASSFFHVMPKDRHDNGGGWVEEVYLVEFLARYPQMLGIKPLSWFIRRYLLVDMRVERAHREELW